MATVIKFILEDLKRYNYQYFNFALLFIKLKELIQAVNASKAKGLFLFGLSL